MDYAIRGNGNGQYDLIKSSYDLALDDGFFGAICISLLTDSGWWGNAITHESVGSQVRLLGNASLQQIEDECRRNLNWIISDGHANELAVAVRRDKNTTLVEVFIAGAIVRVQL